MAQLRVVTSHPAKQAAVYHISEQLAKRRYLAAHLAATYYLPGKYPYRLASYVPGEAARHLRRQFMKRRYEPLPDGLVIDWPWVELAMRALQEMPGLKSLMAYQEPYRAVEAAHDRVAARWIRKHRDLDIVIAYHGSALHTLRATREVGARAVLSVIHPVNSDRIIAEEYKKLGRQEKPPSTAPRLWRELEVADYFLTPSSMTTESLLELGIPAPRIKEIPWGIDVGGPAEPPAPEPANRVRFLFVGKLSVHKGLHILRQAWSSITSPNVSLTIVGRPTRPFEAALMREWMDEKDDRVHVIDEARPDINAVYRQADVFVFPSLVEGFGMVTLEAMASGLPVIVTDGSRAVVRHGLDGFVLRPGDADGVARCMIQLAEQPRLRAELGRNAYIRARQYPWDRFGSELSDWLVSIAVPDGLNSQIATEGESRY